MSFSSLQLDGGNALGLLAAVGGGFVFVALAVLIRRWRRWRQSQQDAPGRLLKELCTAHRLRARERRLILQLAAHQQLEHPATLFLEPALWERDRSGEVGVRRSRELAALAQQLFGQPVDA
jgi:hypothetical protein